MFEKFTDAAREVVAVGQEYAKKQGCVAMERGHVLLALACVESPAALAIRRCTSIEELERRVETIPYEKAEGMAAANDQPQASGEMQVVYHACDLASRAENVRNAYAESVGITPVEMLHQLIGSIRGTYLDDPERWVLPVGLDYQALYTAVNDSEAAAHAQERFRAAREAVEDADEPVPVPPFQAGPMVAFMYLLLRDVAPVGQIVGLVRWLEEAGGTDPSTVYAMTNELLAADAMALNARLTGVDRGHAVTLAIAGLRHANDPSAKHDQGAVVLS